MTEQEAAETSILEMMKVNELVIVIITDLRIAKNTLSHHSFLTFVFIETNVLQLKVEQICGKCLKRASFGRQFLEF